MFAKLQKLALALTTALAIAPLLAVLTSCADDTPAVGAADVDMDAVPDSDPDGDTPPETDLQPPQPLTVIVETEPYLGAAMRPRPSRPWGPRTPLPDALVTVDFPDGSRLERTTDATGQLELEPIDWSAGPVAVTAYLEGHDLETRVFDEPPEGHRLAIALWPTNFQWPETVTVSGSVLNAVPGLFLAVDADVMGTYFEARSQRWSIEVPAGVPFNLLAYQTAFSSVDCFSFERPVVRSAVLAHEAVTEPTTDVVIDFDEHAVVPRYLSGSFTVPSRAGSVVPEGDWGYLHLSVGGSLGAGLTVASHMGFDPVALRYDYEIPMFTGIGTGELLFVFQVNEGCSGDWGRSFEGERPWGTDSVGRGAPEGGDLGRVLDIPEWRVEPNCDGRFSLEEPFSWETHEPDVYTGITIQSEGSPQLWYVRAGPGLSSMRVPALPSNLTESEVFGSTPTARLSTWEPRDPDLWAEAWNDVHLPITLSCE